jgi:hypothetical protein
MLEGPERHPFTKNMIKSQRKKLSVKISFEMIMVCKPTTGSGGKY